MAGRALATAFAARLTGFIVRQEDCQKEVEEIQKNQTLTALHHFLDDNFPFPLALPSHPNSVGRLRLMSDVNVGFRRSQIIMHCGSR
jgi:hypothetical protein